MKRRLLAYVLTVAFAAAAVGTTLFAASSAPGSADDPLVSRSYVDQKIAQITGAGSSDALVNEALARLEPLLASRAGGAYTPVNVTRGQYLIGGEGTEIILRSGTAVAHAPGADGVSDVTEGADLAQNANVHRNHLLIVPRDDGRGVRVTADEAWFLVKGAYRIEK